MALLAAILAAAIGMLGAIVWRQRLLLRQLAAESRHDPLTGLANRRALHAHWEKMPVAAALVLVDLVGFKAVNDQHGHIVGDALLRQVAARLETAATPGLLARWGGDEFAVIVPEGELDARLLQLETALRLPFDLSAAGGPAQVTIGARAGVSKGGATLADAERGAATALLAAKQDGGNKPT